MLVIFGSESSYLWVIFDAYPPMPRPCLETEGLMSTVDALDRALAIVGHEQSLPLSVCAAEIGCIFH